MLARMSGNSTSILAKAKIVPIDEHLKYTILEENRREDEEEATDSEIIELSDGIVTLLDVSPSLLKICSSIPGRIFMDIQHISIRRQEGSLLDDVSAVRVDVLIQRA